MCNGDRFEPLRDFIWKEMDRRGWSVVAMARAAGVAHGTVSNVLNHVTLPTLYLLERFSIALEVEIADLLALAGYIPPEPPRATEERRLLRAFRSLGAQGRQAVILLAEMLPPVSPFEVLAEGLSEADLGRVRAYMDNLKARACANGAGSV